jgi:PTH2 family peptidyl-tRNA hydrolase
MVLVVRTDLKMTKGKIAAQCCHGAIGAYQQAAEVAPIALRRWERSGCAKVALQVGSEAELIAVYRAVRAHRLPCYLVVDAGRTQIEAGSKTVCAIGPAPVDAINAVTGELKLL